MSPEKERNRRTSSRHMRRRMVPLRGTPVDVDHVSATRAHHLFDAFPDDLVPLAELPVGHLAERDGPGSPWTVEAHDEG